MADEFNLIKTYFEPLCTGLGDDEVGIGDDGAVINIPSDHQLVVVMDTLVSGVHFLEETPPYDIAWKALAVNLSDLAAMAAKPAFFTLALTLPESDQAWLKQFSTGLSDLASQYKISLVGGDTTHGPLSVTVTAHGWVKAGGSVLRSAAKAGDLICVTNQIGSAALALKLIQNNIDADFVRSLSENEQQQLINTLNRPQPQLEIASSISSSMNSAIDISDGLLADLNHILEETNLNRQENSSQLYARIEVEKIPLLGCVRKYVAMTGDWQPVLMGGDDYQLCFSIAEQNWRELQQTNLGKSISVIGKLKKKPARAHGASQEQNAIELVLNDEPLVLSTQRFGYQHF